MGKKIEKVALVKCNSYDQKKVDKAVAKALLSTSLLFSAIPFKTLINEFLFCNIFNHLVYYLY